MKNVKILASKIFGAKHNTGNDTFLINVWMGISKTNIAKSIILWILLCFILDFL
jgi:hypothetical protein